MSATTAELAIRLINSGDRVFVHGGSAVPSVLLKALVDRSADVEDVELVHLHLNGEGAAPTMSARHLHHRALFVDATTRDAVATGAATYIPAFLSDVPALFSSGAKRQSLEDRGDARSGSGGHHHARPRSLGGHRARPRQPARPGCRVACARPHRHRGAAISRRSRRPSPPVGARRRGLVSQRLSPIHVSTAPGGLTAMVRWTTLPSRRVFMTATAPGVCKKTPSMARLSP